MGPNILRCQKFSISCPYLICWATGSIFSIWQVLDPSPCSSHGILDMLLPQRRTRGCGPPGSTGQVSPMMVWPTDMSSLVDLDKGKLSAPQSALAHKNTENCSCTREHCYRELSWINLWHKIYYLVRCMRLRWHQKARGNRKGVGHNCYDCTWIHEQGKSASKMA